MGRGVRQIELELTETTGRLRTDRSSRTPHSDEPSGLPSNPRRALEQWCVAVAGAEEPCVVIDTDYTIVAASEAWCALMGVGRPVTVRGQALLTVVRLRDFADGEELDESEATKIPPVLAIKSEALARGLVRVGATAECQITLDSIATPLWDGGSLAGSLTFFAQLKP